MNLDYARWGIIYLVTDSRLSHRDKNNLMIEAIELYNSGKNRAEIKNNEYEGFIETKGEHQSLGTFTGQRFSARLDTNKGKVKLEFLVTTKVNPNLN